MNFIYYLQQVLEPIVIDGFFFGILLVHGTFIWQLQQDFIDEA